MIQSNWGWTSFISVSGNKSWISLKCTSDGRLHVTNVLLLVQLVEDFVASGLDCGTPVTDNLGLSVVSSVCSTT